MDIPAVGRDRQRPVGSVLSLPGDRGRKIPHELLESRIPMRQCQQREQLQQRERVQRFWVDERQ